MSILWEWGMVIFIIPMECTLTYSIFIDETVGIIQKHWMNRF